MAGRASSVWQALVGRDDSWSDVVARYAEPVRVHHTLDHVEEVLATLDELGTDDHAALLAAVLHDVVYDPTRSDNEAASARYAQHVLAHLEAAVISRTTDLVLATAAHDPCPPDDRPRAALLDADLAVLGEPPERYDRYAAGIREEYRHVPEDAFRAGRRAVLEGFLARPRLFLTGLVHDRCEASARRNLRREIERLG
ncbi:MAG: metal-dependent phosphohydrolase [Actinomycetota bacterium]|nr:metal-dependent phosphohydrolase [Actinomycetota bacterium]